MSEYFKLASKQVQRVARWLLVVGVIAFISLLFPNNARFPYEFSEGMTWQHENVVAPFDFPVLKPQSQMDKELSDLEKEFSPYYRMDLKVWPKVKRRLENRFEEQVKIAANNGQFPDILKHTKKYLDYTVLLYEKIYTQGIIEIAPVHRERGNDFVINFVKGSTTQKKTLESFPQPQDVSETLTDSLPFSKLPEADFLLYVLEDQFEPNVFYDDSLTNRFKKSLLASVSNSSGLVKKGDVIVGKGDVVTPKVYQRLLSFKKQFEESIEASRTPTGIFVGYLLLTTLIVVSYLMYLQNYLPEILQNFSKLTMVMMWLVIFSYLVFAIEQTGTLSAYMLPFCIVPIVVKSFFTDRLAFFTHIVVVLIASFLSSLGYEFTFLQILAGIVAVLTTADTRNWSKFFMAIFFIFVSYFLGFIGLSLISSGSFTDIDWQTTVWLFLNVLLTMLAFPLIPLLGKLFGITTAISLVELSDMNRPLLKELAFKAPGTLQHSLQVSNLAEAAASAIGADPLLVKVGAYYHDIGKTLHPGFFIENQSGVNPHDAIGNMQSTEIILGHVFEGAEMAKKARLPKVLIDFIWTHHGTTRVEYFYRNFVKENPDAEVNESQFRYPGPKPVTKEQSILMMADSLEAASKSLKNPTAEDIDHLVEKIVAFKVSEGQLSDSEMTFQELNTCKMVFGKILKSMLHVRIEYPEEIKSPEKG